MRTHGALLQLGTRVLETPQGPFDLRVFRNLASRALVLVASRGDLQTPAPLLARVHSSCVTSEALHALDCDCAGQLDAALTAIAAEERGALFYLMQEGRGAGLVAKARDRMMVQASGHRLTTFDAYDRMGLRHDQRHYADVASAMRLLEIRAPLHLLSNNPEKRLALEREKIAVAELRAVERDASLYSSHYLEAKRSTGHRLARPPAGRAELPVEVEDFEPRIVPGMQGAVEMARYLLPVSLPGAGPNPVGDGVPASRWLNLHLVCDSRGEDELILLRPLCEGAPNDHRCKPPGGVRLVCEWLPDRLGGRGPENAMRRWLASWQPLIARSASGAACPWFVFAPAPPGRMRVDEARVPALERRASRVAAALDRECAPVCAPA